MKNQTMKRWLIVLLSAICFLFPACKSEQTLLTLSMTEITLEIGDDYVLRSNNAWTTWTVEDESIVKVDARGRVLALAEGTTKITAKANGQSAECIVRVDKPFIIETESVSFANTQVVAQVGESIALHTTVYKNGVISTEKPTFTTDNPEVATVAEDGVVTTSQAGVAKITATYGMAQAVCSVYVSGGESFLLLNQTSVELKTNETFVLSATLFEDGKSIEGTAKWSVSGNNVTTTSNGEIKGVFVGEAVVKAELNGVAAYCTVKVYQEKEIDSVGAFLSIEDNPYITYKLTKDVDFSGFNWTEKNLVAKLSSALNGNGKKIYNLKRTLASDRIGIFGEITASGSIENLAIYFEEFNYTDTSGAVAIYNYGTISNCFIKIDARAKSTTTAEWLRSGVVYENYGVMENLLVEVNAQNASGATPLFHAFAAKNYSVIRNNLVISSAYATKNVTQEDGTVVKNIYYQLLSGSSDVAHFNGYGYTSTAIIDNAQDKRRGECWIFESEQMLMTLGQGGYAIDGSKGRVPQTQKEDLYITGRTLLNAFNADVWTFTPTQITFFGITLYSA